jgi:hypothetical protein
MIVESPAAGFAESATVAERPVALPLKQGGAMSTVDEYRKYARDCLRWANRARTDEQRKQFLSLAREWQEAASSIDGTPPIEPGQRSPPDD